MSEGHKHVPSLEVKFFDKFSMIYNGKNLLGNKTSGTQFVFLMQLLLYNRENGVTREQLEEVLFAGREIEDRFHALQSILYNAKKKLQSGGLPKENFIITKNNVYFWNPDVPVKTDVDEIDQLYAKLRRLTKEESRRDVLREIVKIYTGEFLSPYTGVLWIAVEAKKYHAIFCDCVAELAQIYDEHEEYNEMVNLGLYASRVDPFCDWETITMEAYINLGDYDRVTELYAKTVDIYYKERGLRPSRAFLDSIDRLASKMQHPIEVLDSIQNKLMEGDENPKGGYMCTYPVFQGIYHMLARMLTRGGFSVYLMLCTVVDSKGNPMKEGEKLDKLSERLGDSIIRSVRQSDAITRYGKGQFLVLLLNTTRENCNIIMKRINYNFIVGRQRTGVEFFVNSIFTDSFTEPNPDGMNLN